MKDVSGETARRVRRRLVLYLHGFDPRGPGLLYRMQCEDAGRESARADRTVTIGPRRRQPTAAAWSVTTVWADETVEADYVVLRWDDLVRQRWNRSLWGQAGGLVRWLGAYIRVDALIPLIRVSRALAAAMLALPVAVLIFCMAAILGLGLAVGGTAVLAAALGAPPAAGLAALALALLLPAVWRQFDARANLCWLGRGHLHMVELGRGDVVGMDDRIDRFADRLLGEVDDGGWDDVLVVGHSSGALHAVSMLGAALERRADLGRTGPPVRLVTLGHSLPLYVRLGQNARDAQALSVLVEANWIAWTDVVAPADPAASGALSPFSFSPWEAHTARVNRHRTRFHQALAPAAFRALKRNPMAYHFQYMRPSDDPDVYDWHRLAFGPGEIQ